MVYVHKTFFKVCARNYIPSFLRFISKRPLICGMHFSNGLLQFVPHKLLIRCTGAIIFCSAALLREIKFVGQDEMSCRHHEIFLKVCLEFAQIMLK